MRIRDLALRKALRQAKPAEFAAESGGDPRHRLALARLGGTAALAQVAADAALPADLRELAAWSAGDPCDGLKAMRRRPGWQGLAEGWLLLLRGEAPRAIESFLRAEAGQLRRATLGAGVASALAGDLAAAELHLRTLGPFPQSAYPAASALIRIVTRHGAGWDPAALRRLLREGTLAEVDRAVASCPGDRAEERGWLLLRRGDLRQAGRPGDVRAEQDWLVAGGAWPGLRADVLKRRFWFQLRRHETTAHLAALHRELAERDAILAREAVLTIGETLCGGEQVDVDGPWQACTTAVQALKLAPEWLWWWTGCMIFAAEGRAQGGGLTDELRHRNAGLARPPRLWREWKPVFAKLEAGLPDMTRNLRGLKLSVLAICRERGERRKTIFAILLDEPERRDELLLAWCSEAACDMRGKRQIAAEFVRLHELFTGDLDLTLLHCSMQTPPPAELDRLLAAMPTDHAALVRWTLSPGPVPDGLAGRDERVDERLLGFLQRMPVKQAAALRKVLWQRPEHFLRVLGRVAAARHLTIYRSEAVHWVDGQPRCWQARYARGRVAELGRDDGIAAAMEQAEHWDAALRLDPPAQASERQEMERFFAKHPMLRGTLEPDEADDREASDLPGLEELGRVLGDLIGGRRPGRRRQTRTRLDLPPAPAAPVPPVAKAPSAPRIDLETIAAEAGCSSALALAGMPTMCALTRSTTGPGSWPFASPEMAEEIAQLNRFAIFLRPHLRKPEHRAWLDGLLANLAKPPEPCPF